MPRSPRFQDDSDDSDRASGRGSPRHSWYTANRKRGGHASDVNHSTPFARAAALTKARAAEHPPSVPTTGGPAAAAGGNETTLPVDEPQQVGTNAAEATGAIADGGRGGGGLQNAVSARQHRSPSWHQQARGGEVGDAAEAVAEAGASSAGAMAPAAGTGRKEGDPAAAARGSGNGTGTGKQRSSKQTPPTGGVSARLHHSPSRILQGGATVRGESVGAGARTAATATPTAVRNSPSVQAAAGKKQSELEASPATPSGNQNQGATHPRTPATRPAASGSQSSSRQTKTPAYADNTSSPHGGLGSTPATNTLSGTTKNKWSGGGTKAGSSIGLATVAHQRKNTSRSKANDPVACTPGAPASHVGTQQKRGREGPAGQPRMEQKQQQQQPPPPPQPRSERYGRAYNTSSAKTNNNKSSGDGVPNATAAASDTRRHKPSADNGLNSGIPSSLQNYKPFSRRRNGERSWSGGVMLGRGRSTPLRPSFFVSLPEEEPPPPPSPSPFLALGDRRPSIGPVNPRAMYGHVPPPPSPPPPPDEQPKISGNGNSSLVAVLTPSGDKEGPAADSNAGTKQGSRAAVATTLASRSSSGGGSGVRKSQAVTKDQRRTDQMKGSRSEPAMLALSKRKGKHDPGEESGLNNIPTRRTVPGKKAGVSSSPNLLSNAGQGVIKVEKIQLSVAKPEARGDASGGRGAGGVAGAFAPPGNSKTGWRSTASRDTAAGIEFAESSVQELRKLAAASVAARQKRSSSSSSGEEGGESGDAAEAECVRGRPKAHEGGSSKEAMGWEQQLRAMAEVGLSPAASSTTRRQRSGVGHRNQRSRDMGTGGGGRATENIGGETQEKVSPQPLT